MTVKTENHKLDKNVVRKPEGKPKVILGGGRDLMSVNWDEFQKTKHGK
jgi:hypothetical protein